MDGYVYPPEYLNEDFLYITHQTLNDFDHKVAKNFDEMMKQTIEYVIKERRLSPDVLLEIHEKYHNVILSTYQEKREDVNDGYDQLWADALKNFISKTLPQKTLATKSHKM